MKMRNNFGAIANGGWPAEGWRRESCARWSLLKVLASGNGATSGCSPQSTIYCTLCSSRTSFLFSTPIIVDWKLHKGQLSRNIWLKMDLPPFSIDQLSKLVASSLPSSQLFEILSQYEMDACLISGNPEEEDGESQLLSLFYSTFFFSHLLTKQMWVSLHVSALKLNNLWDRVDLKPAP